MTWADAATGSTPDVSCPPKPPGHIGLNRQVKGRPQRRRTASTTAEPTSKPAHTRCAIIIVSRSRVDWRARTANPVERDVTVPIDSRKLPQRPQSQGPLFQECRSPRPPSQPRLQPAQPGWHRRGACPEQPWRDCPLRERVSWQPSDRRSTERRHAPAGERIEYRSGPAQANWRMMSAGSTATAGVSRSHSAMSQRQSTRAVMGQPQRSPNSPGQIWKGCDQGGGAQQGGDGGRTQRRSVTTAPAPARA